MTNKLKYFIGNWKMFGDFSSLKIIKRINNFYLKFRKKNKNGKVILCVPNILINFFNSKLNSDVILIGAQNCSHNKNYGPFTGSVSASMLKKSGANYVILGHSENRFEGESNKLIMQKIENALEANLKVIFCIGETQKQKNKGQTFSVISNQLKQSIKKSFDKNKIIIAYEPVWSIGSGKIPKKNELIKTFKFIKNLYKKLFKTKKYPKVLYGGSVNNKNITLFSKISEIDGFLIGGASQSSKKFIDIIKKYYK